jgi:hypothetical protein
MYLLIGMCVVTGLYLYNNYQGKLLRDIHINKVEINANDSLLGGPISNDPEVNATIQSKDYQRTVNPLLPPERTYPYGNPSIQEIQNRTPKLPINIPTRGETGIYSQVGILTAPDENNPTILPLYGKPTYPGSSRWLYYTSTDKLPSIKIPLKHKEKECSGDQGCDEIQGQETINVPAYVGKDFNVEMYKMDTPRYIPYV